jgi:DoxX-like family
MATNTGKLRFILYWLTSVAAALLFAVPGCALLVKAAHFETEMARLGYPDYFLFPFGLFKIFGAGTILAPGFPRLKEWAYAGMVFDVAFATYSRAAVNDPLSQVLFPLVIGTLAVASWALRPASRKL